MRAAGNSWRQVGGAWDGQLEFGAIGCEECGQECHKNCSEQEDATNGSKGAWLLETITPDGGRYVEYMPQSPTFRHVEYMILLPSGTADI